MEGSGQFDGDRQSGQSGGLFADDSNTSGNAPPAISLPKGGGAIRDIGEKFEVNAVTGTGSMSIPIAISAGRGSPQPTVGLSYSSGAGAGPFGLGWNLSSPLISRKTDKGIPRYRDGAGDGDGDVFTMGGEDLVPLFERDSSGGVVVDSNGMPAFKEFSRDGYAIRTYGPRIEGAYQRIERWTLATDPNQIYWRTISATNVTSIFGRDDNSRIYGPDSSLGQKQIFTWLLAESFAADGNACVYTYKPEDSSNVPLSQANEQNRTAKSRSTHRYLKSISYGNRVANRDMSTWASFSAANLPENTWMFTVVFDYGEHDEILPTAKEIRQWPCRQDPFSSYRSGFEIRFYRLCRRILLFHHFPADLGRDDYLVKATELEYDETQYSSFLTKATEVGYMFDGQKYVSKALPPLEMSYSAFPSESQLAQLTAQDVGIENLENIPAGVDGFSVKWIDLDGEALAGAFVEQGNAWYYKRNLSANNFVNSETQTPKFGPLERIDPKPVSRLADNRIQLISLENDGRLDVVSTGEMSWGYYERTEEGWASYLEFKSYPNINTRNPELKFIDVTGDGLPDILISEDNAFTYYTSLGHDGYAEGVRVSKAFDEVSGARVIFADPEQTIYLADMSGDGLVDLLRVRNGDICYWPNLGYGRFGPRVQMDNAPWFDPVDLFNQKFIHLADIDGSGTTDVLYIGRNGVDIYRNQCGNGFGSLIRISSFPRVDLASKVSVIDLLGNGVPCIVWTSPLTSPGQSSMSYIDPMLGMKPNLLVKAINNMGAETRIHYAPSTKFYLDDKMSGSPWVTKLPFPVHCVEKVETFDIISQNRFESRYMYHHGYFDGFEREFRGFAMVEQWDTQEMSAMIKSTKPLPTNIHPSWYIPPAHTKTWFHTGAFLDRDKISRYLAHEYFGAPPTSNAKDFDAFLMTLLDDTILPETASAYEEVREACRSLKGQTLRTEVYSDDGSDKSHLPYVISESNYSINPLQSLPDSHLHSIFAVQQRETITYNLERNIDDPRISHHMTLETDNYGNPLKELKIAYGRKPGMTHLSGDDRQTQETTLLVYHENDLTNMIISPDEYRLPMPAESRSYQIYGFELGGRLRFSLTDFVAGQDSLLASLPETAFEDRGTTQSKQKRQFESTRILYRSNDLSQLLSLGKLESSAVLGETYKLVFTPGLLEKVFKRSSGGSVLENLIPNPALTLGRNGGDQGCYVQLDSDGKWWTPSGRSYFHTDAIASAQQELVEARAHFFRSRRHTGLSGENTTIYYDQYDLLPVRTIDPFNNIIESRNDYRVLQTDFITDSNGNRTQYAFDELARAVGRADMGKSTESLGDSLDGFQTVITQDDVEQFFNDPKGPKAFSILGNASNRVVYNVQRYVLSEGDPGLPVFSASISRESHVSDSLQTKIQLSFTYFDGFGRQIQRKVQAEPGPIDNAGNGLVVERWVGTGWTTYNNKGKPVRQYEPFFDVTHDFESDATFGVSSTLLYDPLGRNTATILPNYAWTKSVFNPWQLKVYDTIDNVLQSDPRKDPDVGSLFQPLPESAFLPSWYDARIGGQKGPDERLAATKAARNANTPTTTDLDPLGRTFIATVDNGSAGMYSTRKMADIQGNILQTTDAKGRVVEYCDFNMIGSRIHTSNMDMGERWILADAMGKTILCWDSRNQRFRSVYDALRRPNEVWFGTGDLTSEVLIGRYVYGDSSPDGAGHNQRGRVSEMYDQAGVVKNSDYDFKGNLLRLQRQFATNYKDLLDWSGAVRLENPAYESGAKYDALNRKTEVTSPESSIIRYAYNQANLLGQISTNLRGEQQSGQLVWTPFVNDVKYNAKGQRMQISYGNGVTTTYTYDQYTFRMVNLKTLRGNKDALQDLSYIYDPVGNIAKISDNAQQTVYFRNKRVDPSSEFTYDAIYRLMEATGREHLGQTNGIVDAPTPPSAFDAFSTSLDHPGDGKALGRYNEVYSYDEVGNIVSLSHQGTDPSQPGWTRRYTYKEPSQLDATASCNRLSATVVGNAMDQYHYDGLAGIHGNITAMPSLPMMTWDFKDNLRSSSKQVVSNGGTPETTWYVYGSNGERVRKVTERQAAPGQVPVILKERLYLNISEVYRTYDGSGSLALERETLSIMDDRERIAIVETRTQSTGSDNSPARLIRYHYTNHSGSAVLELDDQAQIISYEEYTPFGSTSYQAVRSQTETPKRYRYSGKERDEESGLYYFGSRYYISSIGRWLNADPDGTKDGTNVYAYVHNNPINRIDPSGRQGQGLSTESLVRLAEEIAYKATWIVSEKLERGELSVTATDPGGFGKLAAREFVSVLADYKRAGVPGADQLFAEVAINRQTGLVTHVGNSPIGGNVNLDVLGIKAGTRPPTPGLPLQFGQGQVVMDMKTSGDGRISTEHAGFADRAYTLIPGGGSIEKVTSSPDLPDFTKIGPANDTGGFNETPAANDNKPVAANDNGDWTKAGPANDTTPPTEEEQLSTPSSGPVLKSGGGPIATGTFSTSVANVSRGVGRAIVPGAAELEDGFSSLATYYQGSVASGPLRDAATLTSIVSGAGAVGGLAGVGGEQAAKLVGASPSTAKAVGEVTSVGVGAVVGASIGGAVAAGAVTGAEWGVFLGPWGVPIGAGVGALAGLGGYYLLR